MSMWAAAGVRLWMALLAVGLFLLLVPEPEKTPLVSAAGWTSAGFHASAPGPAPQLSRQVRSSSELVLWRSWSPAERSQPGRLESHPFDPPAFIAIPVVGYPAFEGLAAYLECVDTGHQLHLAAGNLHEGWLERTIRLPRRWCAGKARLVAVSRSRNWYVGVGTPFRSSLIAYAKESGPVILLVHAIVFALLLGPGLALARWARSRNLISLPAAVVSLPLAGLLGYACFFVAYYLGVAASTAMSVAVLASVPALWQRHRQETRDASADLLLPLGLSFVYSLACVLLLFAPDGGTGTWTATYRYWPAVWSSDNQLQQMVAEQMYHGKPLAGLLQPWRVSDRPPLMAGTLLLLRPLWQPLLGVEGNERLFFYFHQTAGMVLNSFWIPATWFLLRGMRLQRRSAFVTVALVGCTGFALFNTTYIWAKLIGGGLALVGYVLLARARAGEQSLGLESWLAFGVSMALSLMSHGGVVFGLVPLAPLAARAVLRSRARHVAAGTLTAALVLLPWVVWQRTVDPPGNALVKFAFAGTWGFDEEDVGVWATVERAYRSVSPGEWLYARLEAVKTTLGWHVDPQVAWVTRLRGADELPGRLRLGDFLFFFPSLRFLHVGWLALAFSRWWRPEQRRQLAFVRRTVALGLAGVAVSVVLLWRIHVAHTLSYLSLLLVMAGLTAALISVDHPLCRAAVACQVGYFTAVWVLDPLSWAWTVRWDVVVSLVIPAGAAVWLWRLTRHPPLPDEFDDEPSYAGGSTRFVETRTST